MAHHGGRRMVSALAWRKLRTTHRGKQTAVASSYKWEKETLICITTQVHFKFHRTKLKRKYQEYFSDYKLIIFIVFTHFPTSCCQLKCTNPWNKISIWHWPTSLVTGFFWQREAFPISLFIDNMCCSKEIVFTVDRCTRNWEVLVCHFG